jgi:hydrogenase maturation protease
MIPPAVRRPPPDLRRPATRDAPVPTGRRATWVDILACGSPDRGDDGVGLAVAEALRGCLPDGVRIRIVGMLQVDDLLSVARGGAVIVVDAATGVRGGHIVDLPLDGLIDRADHLRPRSSHALGFREVIGVAEVIRGHPLPGRIIAVGGVRFGLGAGLSPSVRRAVPRMVAAIQAAIAQLRT